MVYRKRRWNSWSNVYFVVRHLFISRLVPEIEKHAPLRGNSQAVVLIIGVASAALRLNGVESIARSLKSHGRRSRTRGVPELRSSIKRS